MSSGTGCLSCPDPIPACSCAPGQFCQTIQRNCNRCPYNQCLDPSRGSSGRSGTNIGVSIGGAVGGIVGVALILALVYWFWWKPRGLAASRKRYSRHLEHRQSKMLQLKTQGGNDRRDLNAPEPTSPALATKRTSVHLSMLLDGTGADRRLSRRGNSPGGGQRDSASLPTSVGATGGHSSRTSFESDNPFGDHNRSSIGSYGDNDRTDAQSARTSEFSFRSSHSTNIIPIAYIPPHSNSVSLGDAQGSARGAYGELTSEQISGGSTSGPRSPRVPQIRHSVPTSMASRDSLAPANSRDDGSIGDLISLHPLPHIASPATTSSSSFAALSTPAGAPIRPPRSPGLDLQLPKSSQPITSTPLSTPSQSVRNSIPLPLRPNSNSFLSSAPLSPTDRDRLSTITTATSRSGQSTMSYILDPPQIITPVNAQGLRRVDIVGRGQAGLVRLGGAQTTPTVTAATTPDSQSTVSSPTSETTFGGAPPALGEPILHDDPFSDAAGVRTSTFSLEDIVNDQQHVRSDSQNTARMLGADDDDAQLHDAESAASFRLAQDNDSRWTVSSTSTSMNGELVALDPQPPSSRSHSRADAATGAGVDLKTNSVASSFFGVPHSARSSQVSLGEERSGQGSNATGIRLSVATTDGSRNDGRASSFISTRSGATDSLSMLDGIPFVASTVPDLPGPISPTRASMAGAATAADETSSLAASLPSPPLARTPSFVSRASVGPADAEREDLDQAGVASSLDVGNEDEDTPLPAPFLPFAGQRPSSTAATGSKTAAAAAGGTSRATDRSERVQSQAMSVRSGFASGLSQIPFQLDGGLRDSMMMSLGADDENDDDDDNHGDRDEHDRRSIASLAVSPSSTAGAGRASRLSAVSDAPTRSSWASGVSSVSASTDADELENAVVTTVVRTPMTLQRSTSVKHSEQLPVTDRITSRDEEDERDPFGAHAEVHDGELYRQQRDSRSAMDARGSMDSLALAAELSRNLEAAGDEDGRY